MNIALYVNSLILNAATLTADGATASVGFDPLKKIIIALVIGLIVGLLYALSLKSQLTSVYKNETAADYVRPASFKVSDREDGETETTRSVNISPKPLLGGLFCK